MTESAFHVPSVEKIACPLDKATAACSIAKLRHYHLSRALIADWLKSRREIDGGGREGKAVIMTARRHDYSRRKRQPD